MQIWQAMRSPVVRISPEETVQAAAAMLRSYQVPTLPVCGPDGRLRGIITDRDLVTRCVAVGIQPERMQVRQVMTENALWLTPEEDTDQAEKLMRSRGIHRLPILKNDRLCGVLSLGDIQRAREGEETLYSMPTGADKVHKNNIGKK